MALLSWLYKTMGYLLPREEVTGKRRTDFSCKLYHLQVRHLGLDLRLMRRKGWGRHNRRLGDGSDRRSVFGGSYVLSVLAEATPCSNNVHTLSTTSDIIQYLHQAAFVPVVSTWTTTITTGFFTTWPGLNSALVYKHLSKSLATAKGHLRQDRQTYDPPKPLLLSLPSPRRLL